MSWKKHFKLANTSGQNSPLGSISSTNTPQYRHYQSQLPELYTGHPNRIDRYNQIENMDASTEINTALDIIAEFSTQKHPITGMVFDIEFNETPSDSEAKIIKEQLRQWIIMNELNKRMFKMFRSTIKYGDQVFIRDPETFKLLWTEISKVTKVIVNEASGKEPEQYVIKDLNPNLMNLSMTGINSSDTFVTHPQVGGPSGAYIQPRSPYSGGSRFSHTQEETPVAAEHIVHLSLTEGLDPYWPFGTSILEQVFKVFKQKELLEDAVIIYRIQRAPERRVFKIDVGDMPPHLAMSYVERIKNEIHQRRIPTNTGGGSNMVDSTYSPLATLEDFFFPIGENGRGSDVTVLPPGANIGEITDMKFFTNKLLRGLRIPPSYLPFGEDDSDRAFNDGKVGTALIQEWQFNQYCKRLQSLMIDNFDTEFKMFMRWRGINIDGQIFRLVFNEPQNFAQYRQADVDSQRISTFTQMEGYGYMSKRFLMKRYLGLSEAEIEENNELWAEENSDYEDSQPDNASLRSVGITPGSIESDIGSIEGMEGESMPEMEPPSPANTVEAPPAPPSPMSGSAEGGM